MHGRSLLQRTDISSLGGEGGLYTQTSCFGKEVGSGDLDKEGVVTRLLRRRRPRARGVFFGMCLRFSRCVVFSGFCRRNRAEPHGRGILKVIHGQYIWKHNRKTRVDTAYVHCDALCVSATLLQLHNIITHHNGIDVPFFGMESNDVAVHNVLSAVGGYVVDEIYFVSGTHRLFSRRDWFSLDHSNIAG